MSHTKIDSRLMTTKGRARRVRTVTAAYTVTLDDDIIICAGAAPFTLSLPPAASCFDAGEGTSHVFTVINPDTDDATVDPSGAETINGAATLVLDVQYEWCLIFTDGTSWYALV